MNSIGRKMCRVWHWLLCLLGKHEWCQLGREHCWWCGTISERGWNEPPLERKT